MKMIGNGAMGSRRRFLAEQAAFMEETFGKSSPDQADLHVVGTLRPVRLRRQGQFQRQSPSSVARGISRLAKEKNQPDAMIAKREPLKTSISDEDAHRLVGRHGLKGPLPKNLSREQKMAAYEARYVTAGGQKAEKWSHRASTADKVKNVGLGIATAGGAAWLGHRAAGYRSLKAVRKMPIAHHAETVAATGAVAGGSGELYAAHARRKRSSYASAPAGVAASSLRRMRDYTPD